jgi:hypothetical protein
MSDLTLATKSLNQATKTGRKPEARLDDLCEAVRRIIAHLTKAEKQGKRSASNSE